MRKFIIKQFALSYTVKRKNRYFSQGRATTKIFPLFVLFGLCLMFDAPAPLQHIIFLLLTVNVFFGFIYFRLYPLSDKDYVYLSDSQKISYNTYYNKNKELINIKYDSIWYLLINPILTIIFLIIFVFI